MSKLDINILKRVADTLEVDLHDYTHFVETGTFVGDTIIKLHPHFIKLSTIELSLDLFLQFNQKKIDYNLNNVENHLGDSIVVLPGLLLTSYADNIIFWLDGHYSGQTWAGETGLGIKECPLLEECSYIDKFCKSKKCIILIDDYNLFENKSTFDWSDINIKSIQNSFKSFNIKKIQMFNTFGELQPHCDILAISLEK